MDTRSRWSFCQIGQVTSPKTTTMPATTASAIQAAFAAVRPGRVPTRWRMPWTARPIQVPMR